MSESKPREHSQEEMLIKFLEHIKINKDYWSNVKLEGEQDCLETRMNGLCFSFLTMLDGVSMEMPVLELVPVTHPADEEYLKNEGENWWPNQSKKFDSSGLKTIHGCGMMLHDLWHDFCRGNVTVESLKK